MDCSWRWWPRKSLNGRVLELIEAFLESEVHDGEQTLKPTGGTPQGGVISPLLANIFLNPLDHLLEEQGFEMVRYADDFVILCGTEEQAEKALEVVGSWTKVQGLTLHPQKTKIIEESEGSFDFLGYCFKRGKKYPSEKAKRGYL